VEHATHRTVIETKLIFETEISLQSSIPFPTVQCEPKKVTFFVFEFPLLLDALYLQFCLLAYHFH